VSLAQIAYQSGVARLVWDDEVIAQEVPPTQSFGPASVCPPAGAFLQATKDGEAALLSSVQEIVGEADRIADLFAGCGTFALPLARTAEVHAVESEPDMLSALDQGWRMAKGLKKVTHEARDLFRRPLMPYELRKLDAVVIDPPRAGAEAQIAEIVKSDVPRLAYVSCNPVTFSRDAAILSEAGWTVDWVQVVDQFRWASHVELAAQLTAPIWPESSRGRE
jgi:23S rRNA (uracil1939-C5)-methyltransferase